MLCGSAATIAMLGADVYLRGGRVGDPRGIFRGRQ